MTIIRFFWKIFDSLLLRRSRASFASSDASAEAFYVELDRQLNQVHHRQWQHAAGLWRATEDCPSAFRIQTGEFSNNDMRHISTCHLCWLIYDLSRFERSVESLWRRYRQAKSWLAHSPSAPVAAGCVVIILLIAISFRLKPPAIPSRHGELAPPTPTLPVHVAPKRVQEPSQDGGSEDAALRRLPPGIEIQRRLGPQYAREFETARVMMGAHISENTDLGRKLANVWLETLRIAGNFSRHRRLSA